MKDLSAADAQVIWEGRPETGLRAPDLGAAGLAFLTTFLALAPGLAAQNAWAWPWAARLGASYAAVVGIVTAFGRVAGGGLRLTLGTAFFAVVTVASFTTSQAGAQLLCPIGCLGITGTLLVMNYRRRRATRYQVTPTTVRLGERERYVIAFPLDAPPAVKRDPFGSGLAEVVFGKVDATLTTRTGKVFKVSAQDQRFSRLRDPQRLLEALKGHVPGESSES